MKVLITGGAGYIGSHTAKLLSDHGFQIVIVDNLSTGNLQSVLPSAKFYNADVRDTKSITEILRKEKVDAVIHFAALLNVRESNEKCVDYISNNVGGLISLLGAMKEANVKRVIFSSTAAVYAPKIDHLSFNESDKLGPINTYGFSKLLCENVLNEVECNSDFQIGILRYFNVAGAPLDLSSGQNHKVPFHLIHLACKFALNSIPKLEIYGNDYPTPDGTCVRDYIHVLDLAEAHRLSLEYLMSGKKQFLFNCGYGNGNSVYEVIRAIEKAANKKLPYTIATRRNGDPAYLIANSSRLKETLGWRPKYDNLDLICETAFGWEKKQAKFVEGTLI
jgi:UDP-glucose 4-epimerase